MIPPQGVHCYVWLRDGVQMTGLVLHPVYWFPFANIEEIQGNRVTRYRGAWWPDTKANEVLLWIGGPDLVHINASEIVAWRKVPGSR